MLTDWAMPASPRRCHNSAVGDVPSFLPVSRPFIGDEECEAVTRVLRSAWIGTGAEAEAFERSLERLGGHVVATSSASIGLQLALISAGVREGDEVIVPAITFAATSHVVLHTGAKLVFADIDPSTGLLDSTDVSRRINPNTKAIIVVDLYGQASDLSPFKGYAGVWLIRDAAQSFGTPGVRAEAGVTTVFSFYSTKNVTTAEGGAVVTSDRAVADHVRLLSKQGVTADAYARYNKSAAYDVDAIGYKANLPDVLAAIGRVQLRKEPAMRERRQQICERYQSEIPLPTITWSKRTNYHLYPVFVDSREEFRDALRERGIGTGVHFECIPGHRAYRTLGHRPEDTPQAMAFGARQVSLPTYPGLSRTDQDRVITAVGEHLRTQRT